MPTTDPFWPDGAVLPSASRSCLRVASADLRRARLLREPMQKVCPIWRPTASSSTACTRASPNPRPDGQARGQAHFLHDRSSRRQSARSRAEIVSRGMKPRLTAAPGRTAISSILTPSGASSSTASRASKRPLGDASWLERLLRSQLPHTLDILQSLGFKYHIDEPSADQPFIVKLKAETL